MSGQFQALSGFDVAGLQLGGIQSDGVSNAVGFEEPPREPPQEIGGLPLDPIQYLPYEISTSIISDALSLYGDYTSRILELTTVSRIWQNFLLSTPVLWSEIYLDDRQPDFLATVAIFVRLSSEVALKVAIYDRPMNGWPGLLPILSPVHQRITSLTVLETKFRIEYDSEGISGIISAIGTFFDRLGPLPQLQELAFVEDAKPTISVFDSLDLPSTIRLSGTLEVPMPRSARSSATPGRFFDIKNYNSFGPTPLVAPLFRRCTLSLGWLFDTYETTVQMTEEVLSHLKLSSKYIHERIFSSEATNSPDSNSTPTSVITKLTVGAAPAEYGLERFTHVIGTSLCHLEIAVSLSHIEDLANLLRLLTRLESLSLEIVVSEIEGSTEIPPSSIVVPQLRSLFVVFANSPEFALQSVAQSLWGLFSVLAPLYPGVESLVIWVNTWPFFASSYMESLRRLKYLSLKHASDRGGIQFDSRYDIEEDPITMNSLEQLVVEGHPLIHRLRTPNLLNLRLEKMASGADLEHLGTSHLRKLTIHAEKGVSCTLNPFDYSWLCEIEIGGYEALKRVDILSFSNITSIRLKTLYYTNPEGNLLCTQLLCNPEGCPLLQELHFEEGVEWDILILMLERRNVGLKGIKRIHTVTLPFIPLLIQQILTLLLAGEKADRPPLESISLEATREVLFDPTVWGCCFCLKNMAPGCAVRQVRRGHEIKKFNRGYCVWTPDELFPEHGNSLDTAPGDIRDWMDRRRYLVDAWKSSYSEFLQGFRRLEKCDRRLFDSI